MKTEMRRKIITAALITILALGGLSPLGTRAQVTTSQMSTAELTEQINSLLATIAALQAQLATMQPGGGVSTATKLTSDLTVGSRGTEVVSLQDFLEVNKFLVMPPGVAKGTFGTLTRSAVAAYQSARGISPAAGYFGPLTRARVNNEIAATVPSTPNNPQTPTPPTQTGREGSIDSKLLSTPSAESVEESATNVKVLGVELKAIDSDTSIQRVDARFTATDSTKNMRPWKYFDQVTLYLGSKKIATIDANDRTDWSEEGDSYQIRFTNVNQLIKKNDKQQMYIAVSSLRSINSSDIGQEWTIAIPDNGIRSRDTLNLEHYDGNFARTFTIEDRTIGSIKIRKSNDTPESNIVETSSKSETKNVPLLVFSLEGRNSEINVDELTFTLDSENLGTGSIGNLVRTLHLYHGNTEIASENVSTSTVTFDDLDVTIDRNDTETFTLKADIGKIDGVKNTEGSTLSAELSNISGEDEGGDDVSFTGSASGEAMAFYTKGIHVTLDDTSKQSISTKDQPDKGTFTIQFKVEAFGDDIYIDKSTTENNGDSFSAGSGANYSITNADDNSTIANLDSTAREQANTYIVREGKTETFTLTVAATASESNFAAAALKAINWGYSDDSALDNFYTFDLREFKTNPLYLGV
jgi:peptidoglycan hydrolase-like protein with peptidoglycan-binding domain